MEKCLGFWRPQTVEIKNYKQMKKQLIRSDNRVMLYIKNSNWLELENKKTEEEGKSLWLIREL